MRDEIQSRAIEIGLNNDYSTIVMPVRTGKTFVGLNIAKEYGNVLVSYPSKSIKQSWLDDAEKFGVNIEHITFTTHVSLHKHDLRSYDVVIIDELHEFSEKNWQHVIVNMPNKMVALTATPPVHGAKKRYMDSMCPIRYKILLEDTVGVINKDYEIIVHLLEPDNKYIIPLKGGRKWSEKAKIAFFEGKYVRERNFNDMLILMRAIQGSQTKLNYFKKLVGEIDRGLFFVEFKEQCKEIGLPSHYSGEENDNLEQFQAGKLDKLVTINQLKAGCTFPNLENICILHAYSSNNKAAQKIGRAMNYVEGKIAKIHITCLAGTRDETWTRNGLKEFNQDKVKYIKQKL